MVCRIHEDQTVTDSTTLMLDGLRFPECPRWHEGALWFSDMHDCMVVRLEPGGRAETVVEVPGGPAGLGWLPDGRLLVVSMQDRKLLRLDGNRLVEVADLHGVASYHANDMVVDSKGRAYIGNFGFDVHGGAKLAATNLALVTPDGEVRVAAENMRFPNGSVITPDGKTLIVGESFRSALTAFDILEDGALENRRTWAHLGRRTPPDGCCLDAENGIWVAIPTTFGLVRVVEGGEITDRISLEHDAFACMLGGPEGKTLYVCTAEDSNPHHSENRSGRIEAIEVRIPRAGRP